MAIEFQGGIRTTPLQHEMTPFEAAIQKFEKKAKAYYEQSSNPSEILTEEERKEKLSKALKHLEQERRLAETIVSVQAQLEQYREFGRANRSAENIPTLSAEKRHPTRVLAKYMRAVGRPQPSPRHTPHHIVPGKGCLVESGLARLKLHRFGVRINDPDNGAWLPRAKKDTPNWSMPNAKSHKRYHTHNYERWVFQAVNSKGSELQIRQQLRIIGRMLQDGTQPKKVTLPPDEKWNCL